ncbi:hypothetical protein [Streptomyces sp. KR55]|uniref:hypothetical protein n=1 Tax=Streptomyces sp. KR55 TaxID=3457425 RepID=UPI003FD5206E
MLHYIQLGGGMGDGSGLSIEIMAWAQEHGTAVKASDYASDSSSTENSESSTIYRLDASDVS